MAEGGLPDGMWVHGANCIQVQSPRDVPNISSSLTMMKIAVNSGQRGDRRRKYAKTGKQSAPWTSSLPVTTGNAVNPSSPHVPANPSTAYATRRPWRLTTGVWAASRPNR